MVDADSRFTLDGDMLTGVTAHACMLKECPRNTVGRDDAANPSEVDLAI